MDMSDERDAYAVSIIGWISQGLARAHDQFLGSKRVLVWLADLPITRLPTGHVWII